jgi:hypothetical protein
MSLNQLTEQEKARRWDRLIILLKDPRAKETGVRHLSAMRRAVMLLLSAREELSEGLVAELQAYMVTLDELHLEAIDGLADAEGVLNLFPTYVTESLAGELCQLDTDD